MFEFNDDTQGEETPAETTVEASAPAEGTTPAASETPAPEAEAPAPEPSLAELAIKAHQANVEPVLQAELLAQQLRTEQFAAAVEKAFADTLGISATAQGETLTYGGLTFSVRVEADGTPGTTLCLRRVNSRGTTVTREVRDLEHLGALLSSGEEE